MTTPDRAHVLEAAKAELRSTYTVLADPQCEPSTAMHHLRRSWQALAWLSRGEVPEGPGGTLSQWLAPEHLALIPARKHVPMHACLSTAFALADAPPPWDPQPESEPTQTKSHPPTLPSTRALLAQLRTLDKLLAAIRAEQFGRPLKTQFALRWGLRTLVALASVTAFVMIALRPWQSEDVGPWRGAYYPSKKFEGSPDLRREIDLSFDWKLGPPTDSIPSDDFSARFDSCLILEEASEVAFMLVSNDGSRLFIDDELTVDNWKKTPGTKSRGIKGENIPLSEGVHHLRVEYFDARTHAKLYLTASFDPEQPPGPIPAQMLEFPGMEFDEDSNPCANVR